MKKIIADTTNVVGIKDVGEECFVVAILNPGNPKSERVLMLIELVHNAWSWLSISSTAQVHEFTGHVYTSRDAALRSMMELPCAIWEIPEMSDALLFVATEAERIEYVRREAVMVEDLLRADIFARRDK